MKFTYQTKQKPSATIISFKGDLIDKEQTLELMKDIENRIVENKNHFILNLSELRYVNSSGLNVLINILTKSRNSGGEAIISNVPEKINKLIITTKLNSLFTVAESVVEAAEMLASASLSTGAKKETVK